MFTLTRQMDCLFGLWHHKYPGTQKPLSTESMQCPNSAAIEKMVSVLFSVVVMNMTWHNLIGPCFFVHESKLL